MRDIVNDLARDLSEAHAYLGAAPGPGIDLTVIQIADRSWKAEGRTPCGRAFLLKLYGGDRYGADNQMAFAEFRRKVEEWGLTLAVAWPKVTVEELDETP